MNRAMRIGIVQFPGSNCDQDCWFALSRYLNVEPRFIWHQDEALPDLDGLVVPGGFSYGDYLRSGALAASTKILEEIKVFAAAGGSILGICNGFQILCEAGLLPGTLLPNDPHRFICRMLDLQIQPGPSLYQLANPGVMLRMPIAHGEGRFYAEPQVLRDLWKNGQVVLTYKTNPNGSFQSIAGVCSPNGRVFGLMPHPERSVDLLFGSEDGLVILQSFLASIS